MPCAGSIDEDRASAACRYIRYASPANARTHNRIDRPASVRLIRPPIVRFITACYGQTA
jgi:hypothetical protein